MIFAEQMNYKEDNKSQKLNWNESSVLTFSGNNGGSYIHDALYESYIQAKIDSEDRLAFALKENMVISEADYSNIRALQEAKLSDKIKVRWKKFIAFIKGLVARFMESLSNILLDEKDYLEKYKDIILKKTPKEDLEFSYTGNYTKGINRLMNTTVPLFNYATYQKELEAEGDGDLANKIMPAEFHYTDGDTLDEQFKSFFLVLDDGQKEGKVSSLKMIDLYNFCYNFNKIKGIVDKDINRLEASTRAIESEITKEINSTGTTVTQNTEQQPQQQTQQQVQQNSAMLEAGEGEGNEEKKSDKTDLQIKTSTNAVSKMGSTDERNTDDEKNSANQGIEKAKEGNKESNKISEAADKWIRVCRPLIAAKLTACQQIAKDYMEIIRAHVRSYGGVDKKDKTGNTSPGKATEYYNKSDVEKAKAEAEKAKKEAEKAGQQQGKTT